MEPVDLLKASDLAAVGLADPAGAAARIERLAEDERQRAALGATLPRLLEALARAPDPDQALVNLERYLEVVGNRAVLLETLATHPQACHVLLTLLGSSQFLTEILRRDPLTFYWLLEPATLAPRRREEQAAELARLTHLYHTPTRWANALRRFKRREILRIALRDLLGDADLVATTQELSTLADVLIHEAVGIATARLRDRYGAPRHRTESGGLVPTAFAVIAMGKLGGEELNYSSDVDLALVYAEDGETEGPEVIPNRAFFLKLAEEILDLLTRLSPEGTVFRVDLRLRPEGRSGPLALSLPAYLSYYETRGRLWERQALIKARPSAGDPNLGLEFVERLQPWTYRANVTHEALQEIQAIKDRIDRQLTVRGELERNVKLGRGGIREIEFLIQALQLLYGGEDPGIRERHSLRALQRLAERGYLSWENAGLLSQAYTFLRMVEHRLQILHEFQTHTLPTTPREIGTLARRLRYPGTIAAAGATFLRDYERTTQEVHQLFSDFFTPPPAESAESPPWDSATLARVGFADAEQAERNLRYLWEGPRLAPSPLRIRRALGRLFPALLEVLPSVPQPDEGLNRLETLLSRAGPRAAYLGRLSRDPTLLRRLLTVVSLSERFAWTLAAQPELIDQITDAALPRHRRALLAAFDQLTEPADPLDRLRLWKRAEELRIGWVDLTTGLTHRAVGRALAILAEAAIGIAWRLAEADVMARHGRPRDKTGREISSLVVGVGKLGGREGDYGSDLDLFVLYGDAGETDGPTPVSAHTYFDRLVSLLLQNLTAITRTGAVYQVDLRLRPGGTGAAFALPVDAFRRYVAEAADLWERQALIKARPVWGNPRLARGVRAILRGHVWSRGLTEAERDEIHHLRRRMERELGQEREGRRHVKFGAGGLVDIEFLVQILQLTYGDRHRALRTPNTGAALRALAREGLLDLPEARELEEAYDSLKGIVKMLRLLQLRPPDVLPPSGPGLFRLVRALGRGADDGPAFLEEYARLTAGVRARYTSLTGFRS